MIKRKVIITLFCIFLIISGLFAQDTWMKTYQPFGDVEYYVEDVLVCSDGGYAINGYYYEIDNIIPPPIEEQFGFLMKTNSDGLYQWAQIDYDFDIGFDWNQSSAFVETDDEGFLCSVYSDFGGSVLVKRDSEGNLQWVESCGDFYVHSMDKTSDGNVVLGGRMNGLPAIRKATQNADILWSHTYQIQSSGSGCIKSIISTIDNGYAVTGWENSNGGDIFIMKTDADGDSLWTKTFDGYGDFDEGVCIIENTNQELFLSGRVEVENNYSGIIIKYDTNGNVVWIKEESTEICNKFYSIVNVFNGIVGYGTGNTILTNLYKYDNESNYIWYSPISCTCSARGDRCLRLNNNNFILAGSTEINWDDYITLIKTDSLGQYVNIEEYEITPPHFTFNCYPNPFNPIINFEIKSDDLSDLQLKIFNVKGQIVKTISIETKTINWDANDNASGIYICNLMKKNILLQTKKITLIK